MSGVVLRVGGAWVTTGLYHRTATVVVISGLVVTHRRQSVHQRSVVVPGVCIPKEHTADLFGLELMQRVPDVQRQLVQKLDRFIVHLPQRPERVADIRCVEEWQPLKKLGLGCTEEPLPWVVSQSGHGPNAIGELLRKSKHRLVKQ